MKQVLSRLAISALLLSTAASAEAMKLPVKNIGGKPFYYYTVSKKDRIYQLAEDLGMTRANIIKYNPAAADGLQPGMVLTFPVDIDATTKDGWYCIDYTPAKDETIFGVSKTFNVPVDRIVEFNPQGNKGIHGMTLVIPLAKSNETEGTSDEDKPVTVAETESEETDDTPTGSLLDGIPYTVRRGETIYQIAFNHNIPLEILLDANPRLNPDNMKPGTVIIIPQENRLSDPVVGRTEQIIGSPIPQIIEMPDSAAPEPEIKDTASVALLLPFKLNQEIPDKHAQLVTEFYRGFLMGASQYTRSGNPVKLLVFDSSVDADSVDRILSRDDVQQASVIIAPDSEETLRAIIARAGKSEQMILNPFVVKDTAYMSNPNIIQGIIPHERMYAKAVDNFISTLDGAQPVFLSRIQGTADKAAFTSLLKQRLNADGIEFKEIAYRDFLTAENLEELTIDGASYLFIPASGNRIEFNKFAPALKAFKETGADLRIFGYPEWITFRNETFGMLGALNATIYSRFNFSDSQTAATKIENDYKHWFGTEMLDAIPNQGFFGYDIASFVMENLRNGNQIEPISYDGIESGFSFTRLPDGGFVNENLYFITFNPDGTTAKTVLEK